MSATKYFAFLIWKSKKKCIGKELLIGFVFLLAVIVLDIFNFQISNMIVVTYFLITSIANFISNDVFWNCASFRALGIDTQCRKKFYKMYVVQRLLLDSVISNIILTSGVVIYWMICHRWIQIICFSLMLIVYYSITPWCALIQDQNSKIKNNLSIFFISVSSIVMWIVFINSAQFKYIMRFDSINAVLFTSGVCAAAIVSIFCIMKLRCKTTSNVALKRKLLLWLKKCDIWLFKDYMLNIKMVLVNMISILVTFLIFADNDGFELKNAFMLGLTLTFNLFLTKEKVGNEKKFKLISQDPIFYGAYVQRSDPGNVCISTLKTIISGLVFRIPIMIAAVYLSGTLSLRQLVVYFIAACIATWTEFILLYKDNMLNKIIFYFIKIMVAIVYGITVYCGMGYIFMYVFEITLLAVVIFISKDICSENKKNVSVL